MKLPLLSILLFCGLFLGSAIVFADASVPPPRYKADEVIIKFKPGSINLQNTNGIKSMQDFAADQNLSPETNFSQENISVMKIEDGQSVEEVIQNIQTDPNVEYVQPNFVYTLQMTDPNDTYFGNQRGLKNTGQFDGLSGADIERTRAMDIWSGNSNQDITGTTVAVIDNGLRYTHPEFSGQLWNGISCLSYSGTVLGDCSYGYDTVDMDKDPLAYGDSAQASHGTHVAGIIGAKVNNSIGIAGINSGAKLMVVRAGSGDLLYTDDIINAINFAKYNGAKIINASRGGIDSSCQSVWDQALYDVIKIFPGLFITSAGNGSGGIGQQHLNNWYVEPADYNTDTACWSGLDNIIAVAASTNTDTKASFSDYGTTINIAAPGSGILSTVYTGSYGYMNGTSMATPFVAAVASLARSFRPELSYLDIKNAIIDQAEYVESLSGYVDGGKRLNAYNTLFALDAPTASIIYLTTGWTSGTVLAAITGFSEAITGLNTTGHLFTGNGNFTFTFSDLAGHTGSTTASVTWIDTSTPSIIINSHINNQQITGSSITLTGNLIDTISISGLYINGFYFSGLLGSVCFAIPGGGGGGCGFGGSLISGVDYSYWISGNEGQIIGGRTRTLSLQGGLNSILLTGYDQAGNLINTGIILIRVNYPSNISSAVSGTSVVINFATDLISTGYIVYGMSGLNNNKVGISTTGHSVLITGLTTDGTYFYKVYGLNSGYTGDYSTTGTFIIDTIAPIISTGIVTNVTSQTPTFTFTTTESGTLSRSGVCSSSTLTAASGLNTITLGTLSNATYSGCYVRIIDQVNNTGLRYNLPSFTVNYVAPSGGGPSGGGPGGGNTDPMPTCTLSQLVCDGGEYVLKSGVSCAGGKLGELCSETKVSTGAEKVYKIFTGITISIGGYSPELVNAYNYAYMVGITTVNNITKANLNGTLLRKHLAKMISNFAIKVLKTELNTGRVCTFEDMEDQTEEMQLYAKIACQLGLMGLDNEGNPKDKFSPDTEVTRAQFGTVLSRALWGDEYNGGEPFYIDHLSALKQAEIMTRISTPQTVELRGYVMLMLMRSAE